MQTCQTSFCRPSLPIDILLPYDRPSAFFLPFKGRKKAKTKRNLSQRSAAKEGDEKFLEKYPVHIFRFCEFGLDITDRPFTKSEGVRAILEYYGYNKDEAMALGDDIADIEMFNEVKYGVAVGNAKQELKDIAYLVTDHLAEDGVKKALIKLGVIDE